MKFAFAYTGLRVRDLDREIDFYTRVLGMRLLNRIKVPETVGEFATLTAAGSRHPLELNWYAPESPVAGRYRKGDELDHLAFGVTDLDSALAYMEKKGHPVVMGPIESEHSRWAYVNDPDGIWVELFEVKKKR